MPMLFVSSEAGEQVLKIKQKYSRFQEVGMRGTTMACLCHLGMCYLTSCEDFSAFAADRVLSVCSEGLLKEGDSTKSFGMLRKLSAKDRCIEKLVEVQAALNVFLPIAYDEGLPGAVGFFLG
jgi:hypothetical protein